MENDEGLPYTGSLPLTIATSKDAADQKRNVETERERVLAYIRSRIEGATDDEVQCGLSMAGDTERPRRIELQKMGCIHAAGMRITRKGRRAAVWHFLRPMS